MRKKEKTKKIKWIATGMAAVAATIVISWSAMRPVNIAYKSVKAWTGEISNWYTFSGNVSAKNRQSVFSERAMQISEIPVEKGDTVEKGEVLIVTADGEEIESKISGEIAMVHVQENQHIMPGLQLIDISDYNHPEIVFRADEYDVGALVKGKEVIVEIGAADKKMKGIINDISREGQIVNGVTFYTATVDIENDVNIRMGMSAEVKLLNKQAKNVVILPMDVIAFDENNQPFVLKNGSGNTVVEEKITTGVQNGKYVEIKSGVSSGENVLYKNGFDFEDMLFPQGGKNVHLRGIQE